MPHHVDPDDLALLALGEQPDGVEAGHVAACEQCQDELDALARHRGPGPHPRARGHPGGSAAAGLGGGWWPSSAASAGAQPRDRRGRGRAAGRPTRSAGPAPCWWPPAATLVGIVLGAGLTALLTRQRRRRRHGGRPDPAGGAARPLGQRRGRGRGHRIGPGARAGRHRAHPRATASTRCGCWMPTRSGWSRSGCSTAAPVASRCRRRSMSRGSRSSTSRSSRPTATPRTPATAWCAAHSPVDCWPHHEPAVAAAAWLAQAVDRGRRVVGAVDRRAGDEHVGAGLGAALDGLGRRRRRRPGSTGRGRGP